MPPLSIHTHTTANPVLVKYWLFYMILYKYYINKLQKFLKIRLTLSLFGASFLRKITELLILENALIFSYDKKIYQNFLVKSVI